MLFHMLFTPLFTLLFTPRMQPDRGGRPWFDNPPGRALFTLVTSYLFDGLIMTVIVGNFPLDSTSLLTSLLSLVTSFSSHSSLHLSICTR